jgi:hypothetical protein
VEEVVGDLLRHGEELHQHKEEEEEEEANHHLAQEDGKATEAIVVGTMDRLGLPRQDGVHLLLALSVLEEGTRSALLL